MARTSRTGECPGEHFVAFFLLDETPNLIALHILDGNVDDHTAHEFLALLTGHHKKLHDGVAIRARDALRAADAVAFDQEEALTLNITNCTSH